MISLCLRDPFVEGVHEAWNVSREIRVACLRVDPALDHVGQHGGPVPLTKGWLRASHRKTDPLKSTPYRPFHPHNERWWLTPGACRV